MQQCVLPHIVMQADNLNLMQQCLYKTPWLDFG